MPLPPSVRERVLADRRVRQDLTLSTSQPPPPRSDRDVLLAELDVLANLLDVASAALREVATDLAPTSEDSPSERMDKHLRAVGVARECLTTLGVLPEGKG